MKDFVEIHTREDFINIKSKGNYILMKNIDFEGQSFGDQPIVRKFNGQFEGNGHTLSNFSMEGLWSYRANDYWGIFGYVYGPKTRISNLRVSNVTMYGKNKTGTIAGWLENGALIENCLVENSNFKGSGDYCGMICGVVNYVAPEYPETIIRNCKVVNCQSEWSGIAGQVCYGLLEDCIVEKCRIEVEYHASALVDDLYKSKVCRCVVKDCKLNGTARDMFSDRKESEVIDCRIDGEKKELSLTDKMRNLLESPDAYEQLKDLEELSLWGIYTGQPVAFPIVLTKLTKLKRLNIGNNSWAAIPQEIINLSNLEELQLDASLCYINELPDLSGLKKLKKLRANGNNWFDSRPLPESSLIKSFFNIQSLEYLGIDNWGERKSKGKTLRKALNPEILKGICKLKKLKILDLDRNSLETLPEEIKDMNLKYISLEYNHLDKDDCNRWQNEMTKTVFNLKNNEPPASSGNKYKIDAMLKQAASLLDSNNAGSLVSSVALYNQIQEYFTTGMIDNEYQYTYVLYGKVYAYSFLTSWFKGNFSKEQLEEYNRDQMETAYKTLEFVNKHRAIHFSELGGLQRDLIRRASNSIGWTYVENKEKNKDKLNEIVAIVQQGVDNIENKDHYYIYDTMVRLLIKAGRDKEAYLIVKECLEQYPSFGDFQDFKKNKQYLQWLKNCE